MKNLKPNIILLLLTFIGSAFFSLTFANSAQASHEWECDRIFYQSNDLSCSNVDFSTTFCSIDGSEASACFNDSISDLRVNCFNSFRCGMTLGLASNRGNTLNAGETFNLSWVTNHDPTSCTASGTWSGLKSIFGGTESITAPSTPGNHPYSLSCANSLDSAFDLFILTVNPLPTSTPAPTATPTPTPTRTPTPAPAPACFDNPDGNCTSPQCVAGEDCDCNAECLSNFCNPASGLCSTSPTSTPAPTSTPFPTLAPGITCGTTCGATFCDPGTCPATHVCCRDLVNNFFCEPSALCSLPPTTTPTLPPVVTPTIAPTTTPIPTAAPGMSNVTGIVWVDNGIGGGTASNGIKDGGEIGYSSTARIVAITSIGLPIEKFTDASGNYAFINIVNNTYSITLTLPSGFIFTTPLQVSKTLPPSTIVNFGIVPASAPTPICTGLGTSCFGATCCSPNLCINAWCTGPTPTPKDGALQCAPGAIVNGKCTKVSTAIGPIDVNAASFVTRIMSLLLGISGGIAILLIILAGYTLMTSRDNPESLQDARQRILGAIAGLIFIALALAILEVIGVDVLRIPGFEP